MQETNESLSDVSTRLISLTPGALLTARTVVSAIGLDTRARVVACARTWIGTPYHPCADIRGAGIDCGMLLVRVFVDAGLVPPFDPRPYPPDWHLHRGEERYLGFLLERCRERGPGEAAEPGDIVAFRFGRCFAHGGIVTVREPLTIVHAFLPAGCVLEEVVHQNPTLADPRRARRIFSPFAVSRVAHV